MILHSQPVCKPKAVANSVRLNERQQQAVEYQGSEPLVILASAGTGKTETLTMRVAYLIQEQRVPASNILAVTFTRKAGRRFFSTNSGFQLKIDRGRNEKSLAKYIGCPKLNASSSLQFPPVLSFYYQKQISTVRIRKNAQNCMHENEKTYCRISLKPLHLLTYFLGYSKLEYGEFY